MTASYPVFVHRIAALLQASFRPRLATTPLPFANPSPPSGWIEDLHLQADMHARHTKKSLFPPEAKKGMGCVVVHGGILGAGAIPLPADSGFVVRLRDRPWGPGTAARKQYALSLGLASSTKNNFVPLTFSLSSRQLSKGDAGVTHEYVNFPARYRGYELASQDRMR